jgi:hypothetical protein
VDGTPRLADTGGMTDVAENWRAHVREAAQSGDEDQMRQLFAQAAAIFGASASAEWAKALSGLDGTAVTG